MEKDLCSQSSHNFADLISYFHSENYVLPGNQVTRGEIKQALHSHFADQFKQRYEPARKVVERYGTGMDRMVDEKVSALHEIILFLFSIKKPAGLCVYTRNCGPKAKSDIFYSHLLDQQEALLKIGPNSYTEISKFYPAFETEYSAFIEKFNVFTKSLIFLSGYNDRASELVLEAIHTLKMNPEAYHKKEIRKLIKESIQVIKDVFPDIKQYQQTDALQQYFSQELNHSVIYGFDAGPRRFNIADKNKSERRKAEEAEFKKRGL